jgi:hypothetical protein
MAASSCPLGKPDGLDMPAPTRNVVRSGNLNMLESMPVERRVVDQVLNHGAAQRG